MDALPLRMKIKAANFSILNVKRLTVGKANELFFKDRTQLESLLRHLDNPIENIRLYLFQLSAKLLLDNLVYFS